MLIWSFSIFAIVVVSAWIWPSAAIWIFAGLLLGVGAVAAYLAYWCWQYYKSPELSMCGSKYETWTHNDEP